jgi:hypothetical protein
MDCDGDGVITRSMCGDACDCLPGLVCDPGDRRLRPPRARDRVMRALATHGPVAVDTHDGDETRECRAETSPPSGCFLEACVSGECAPFVRDPSLCPAFPGCEGASVCGDVPPLRPDARESDVPPGCRPPPGWCYIQPPPQLDGPGLDGFCIAGGADAPGNECRFCDVNNPWGYSDRPDGVDCDDEQDCTVNDSCSSGRCIGRCDPTLPGCAGFCDPDGS